MKTLNPALYDSGDVRAASAETTAEALEADRIEQAARYAALPVNRLRALAVGESTLFTQYDHVSRVSNSMARAARSVKGHFTARTQRCLGDGSIEGILVTRVE